MDDEVIARETLDMLHSMRERVQRLELSAGGATKLGAPTEAPEEEDDDFNRGFEIMKDAVNYFISVDHWGVSIEPDDDTYLFTYRGRAADSHFYVRVIPDPGGHRDEDGQVSKMLRVKRLRGAEGILVHPNDLIGFLAKGRSE